MNKICCRCSIIKDCNNFSKKKASKDGYKSHCKICEKLDRIKHFERDKILKRRWLDQNKEKVINRRKLYRQKNKNKLLLKQRQYRRQYESNRLKNDIQHRLKNRLRARLHSALNKKVMTTVEGLGCSISELKAHLESLFQPGMSWDNWSKDGWHIDHIRPLSSFDLSNPEEFKTACHYTNLQPLWAADNLRKSCKIDS